MICKKCAKRKHYKCRNGPWKIGTWCACQHRVQFTPGYAMYLLHKYGGLSQEESKKMIDEREGYAVS